MCPDYIVQKLLYESGTRRLKKYFHKECHKNNLWKCRKKEFEDVCVK